MVVDTVGSHLFSDIFKSGHDIDIHTKALVLKEATLNDSLSSTNIVSNAVHCVRYISNRIQSFIFMVPCIVTLY